MTDYTVFGGNKLPYAFDESMNIYYYKQYKSGNMIAREMLIKHNLRLIFSIIKDRKYDKLTFDIEDLMSIGIEGLIKGIDSFDENKSRTISSYISGCIRFEILNFIRKENYFLEKGYSFVSVDDIAGEKDGNFITNGDVFKIEGNCIEEIVVDRMMKIYYKDIIIRMLDALSDRDREIFMLTYGFVDGRVYKQEEVARKIGVSRGLVSMILVRNLKKMRERLIFEERNIMCKRKMVS